MPDLRLIVHGYLASGDADEMMARAALGRSRPKGVRAMASALIVGERGHMWMYDGPSLTRLVTEMGFNIATVLPAGETTICPVPVRST